VAVSVVFGEHRAPSASDQNCGAPDGDQPSEYPKREHAVAAGRAGGLDGNSVDGVAFCTGQLWDRLDRGAREIIRLRAPGARK